MDNLSKGTPGDKDFNKPIPLEKDANKPIPFDNSNGVSTSRLPSGPGSGGPAKIPSLGAVSQSMKSVVKKPETKTVSADKITGVKTFLAKLHLGSIDFVDQQINEWLKDNPGVIIKRTNTATGMVTGKTTEPHIIVTVWY